MGGNGLFTGHPATNNLLPSMGKNHNYDLPTGYYLDIIFIDYYSMAIEVTDVIVCWTTMDNE